MVHENFSIGQGLRFLGDSLVEVLWRSCGGSMVQLFRMLVPCHSNSPHPASCCSSPEQDRDTSSLRVFYSCQLQRLRKSRQSGAAVSRMPPATEE